ncbi:hypothetical protein ASG17_10460 [Brevundimonas sp. Leaf363]|nr:hypothetical protein ASG17_10460 [Brevundimonas sp. Leaf363]
MLLAPVAALAGDGVWTSGYGQGITEANVANARGVTLRVACTDAALNRAPSVSIDVPNLQGGDSKTVTAQVTIGGRAAAIDFQRRVRDQNQVVYSWDATGRQRHVFDELLFNMTHGGRTASIVLASERVRETFPLQGARTALQACMPD